MRRIVTAREQVGMLSPWRRQAAPRMRFPDIKSKGLDALGFSQRKLNGNFLSWMDTLSDQDKAEGGLWYPTGNDWGHHMADLHGEHPDKAFAVMSKMSPQRDWYGNLGDAHNVVANYRSNPSGILAPAGISGTDNLRQSLRVMGAEDDPDAIHAAFLGTKNVTRGGRKVAVPRTPRDLPKTHDFYTALRDPEAGGAGNYAAQPAVADSWMSRSMLWSQKRWADAHNGGRPLTWPGKGTGEGLDKPLPVKKANPRTGNYEVVGFRPANARDVAARVVGLAGGYDRMRQAMQYGAARHGLPFAHGAQAAVWKAISGNANPDPTPRYNDPSEIQHDPGGLWDEYWARRASGLHVPVGVDRRVGRRTAAVGSTEPEDTLDEGWGAPEDIAAILRHVRLGDQGWDYWEDAPRFGPHPVAERHAAWGKSSEQTRHEVGRFHAPENHPAEDWRDCPNCSWYGLGGPQGWDPDDHQDSFDPRLIGAARDPLLSGVADVLSYSSSLVREAIPENLKGTTWEDSPEWATGVWEHVMRNPDGMTFKDHPGDGPTSGQMVSYPKKEVEDVVPFHMLLPEDLHHHFVTEQGDRINSRPDNYAGGWTSGPPPFDPENPDDVERWGPHGPGPGPHYYLDVSRNEDDPHTMVGEAFAHGQDGLFDLNPGGKGYLQTPEAAAQLYPEQPHQFWTGRRRR